MDTSYNKKQNGQVHYPNSVPEDNAGELAKSGLASTETVNDQFREQQKRRALGSMTLNERRFPGIAAVLKSSHFDAFVGLAICGNAITMGFQAEMLIGRMSHLASAVDICEQIFTTLFALELFAKVVIFGWRRYMPGVGNTWQFLDAALVLTTSVGMNWVCKVLDIEVTPTMQSFAVLRCVRLVRLVDVISKDPRFLEAWLMLRGLQEAMSTLVWTILVIFCITYVFAVFGVVLISVELKSLLDKGEPIDSLYLKTNGIIPMMYTLIQVLTLDSWTGVSREMQLYIWWSWAFFYAYISVVVFVLLNLVTAVIVETALQNTQKSAAQQIEEMQERRKEDFNMVVQGFEELKVDEHGDVKLDEFQKAFDQPIMGTQLKLLGFKREDMEELFKLLDSGDGRLSKEECFAGLQHMQGEATAKEMFRIMNCMMDIEKMMKCYVQETEDDLMQILAAIGLGQTRKQGTLKQRSSIHNRGSAHYLGGVSPLTRRSMNSFAFFDSKLTGGTASGQLSGAAPSSGNDTLRLALIDPGSGLMESIEALSQTVLEFRRGFQERLAESERRVDVLATQVTDLRESLMTLLKRCEVVDGVVATISKSGLCSSPELPMQQNSGSRD